MAKNGAVKTTTSGYSPQRSGHKGERNLKQRERKASNINGNVQKERQSPLHNGNDDAGQDRDPRIIFLGSAEGRPPTLDVGTTNATSTTP